MKLENYHNTCVVQRNPLSGCIPTGIEWLIRYKGLEIPNLDTFQERFDLYARGVGENNFETIAEVIEQEYPQLKFRIVEFGFRQGKEKLYEIERALGEQRPCLISISLHIDGAAGTFHIVPVVEIDEKYVTVLWLHKPTNREQLRKFTRKYLEDVHFTDTGGKDILMFS